jgi:hypothetical protein
MPDFLGYPADIWLPFTFAALMGLSILIYVVLDGYDLGVGVLFVAADPDEKDRMVASIGPFWDANETWLVLAVGLLLVAFPVAHGIILTALYVPVALMLVGLILRGVSFEFRAKVRPEHKGAWNAAFFAGSLMTALSQGYMLGLYIMGLEETLWTVAFAGLTAICLTAGYAFIGACWLIYKTEEILQWKAVRWAKRLVVFVAAGFVALSLASPAVSPPADRGGGHLRRPAADAAPSAGGRRPPCARPLCRDGRAVRPVLRRPRLQLLPLCGAGTDDDLRGRERAGKPRHHAGRHAHRDAGDRRLFGLQLFRLPRQGTGVELRLRPRDHRSQPLGGSVRFAVPGAYPRRRATASPCLRATMRSSLRQTMSCRRLLPADGSPTIATSS